MHKSWLNIQKVVYPIYKCHVYARILTDANILEVCKAVLADTFNVTHHHHHHHQQSRAS
jgi:hypothetical protein